MTKQRVKIIDFLGMDEQERTEKYDTGSMWQQFLEPEMFDEDQYFVFDGQMVITKTGRKIDSITIADETCCCYEKCSDGKYYDDDGNCAGRTVNDVYSHHFC